MASPFSTFDTTNTDINNCDVFGHLIHGVPLLLGTIPKQYLTRCFILAQTTHCRTPSLYTYAIRISASDIFLRCSDRIAGYKGNRNRCDTQKKTRAILSAPVSP